MVISQAIRHPVAQRINAWRREPFAGGQAVSLNVQTIRARLRNANCVALSPLGRSVIATRSVRVHRNEGRPNESACAPGEECQLVGSTRRRRTRTCAPKLPVLALLRVAWVDSGQEILRLTRGGTV